MKIKVVFLIMMFYAITSHSACNEINCSSNIHRLYPTNSADQRVFIELAEENSELSKLDCTLREGKYLTLYGSHPLFKEVYATILAGLMSNKALTYRIVNDSEGCTLSYVMIYGE